MGAILEPTAAMGDWIVEVRRESAYLNGDTLVWRDHGFAIPAGQVSNVIAAIDQIADHPAYIKWAASTSSPRTSWTSEAVGGQLRVIGPAIYYGGHDGPWTAGSVELPYASLSDLRTALASVNA